MMPEANSSYQRARERFLSRCAAAGAAVESATLPDRCGPDEQPLRTDIAWLGPRDASRVVMCVSGTHGIEGHCGSACQAEILTGLSRDGLPPDVAALFVHALNPYGMAYDHRVNEDNVDLNRNWVDHDAVPDNPDYELVHEYLVPPEWTEESLASANQHLLELAAIHGTDFVQAAVTRGQWTHPDGLFYGGHRHAWSTRLLNTICQEYLVTRQELGYIDLHTGLGARGKAEPIFRGGRDAGAFDRADRWYGQVTRSEDGSSSSTPIVGNTATVLADALDGVRLTAITLEFGTLPGLAVLSALRADNWLRLGRCTDPDLAARIKAEIREAFWPTDEGWRANAVALATATYRRALAGIQGDRSMS